MTFKNWWNNYKSIGIFCIIFLVFLIIFEVWNIIGNSKNEVQNEEWVDISEFSNILEMSKEGKILSYPEITVISEVDGEIVNIGVSEGDIVDEWQNLMQIGDEDIENEVVSIENKIGIKFSEYYKKRDEYDQFQSEFGEKITELENQLISDNSVLQIEKEFGSIDNENEIKQRMQEINNQLKELEEKRNTLKSEMIDLENQINEANSQSISYYFEQEKYFPVSSIQGIVSNIYVKDGDEVKVGDKLLTIVNNNIKPEIAVNLDFEEYLLTKNLSNVYVVVENENRGNYYYDGEIYTRSPILNEEGKYTMTIIITDDVWDLVLNDDNTNITVIFGIDSDTQRLPQRCFTGLGNLTGMLILRDGEVITGKEVGIKNKWNNWINVDKFTLFSLEKDEEIDGIELCIDDWNRGVIEENDVDIINWYNQFDGVEKFCEEYIKVNPMYRENRNLAIVSELGGPGEKIEVLCQIE